MAGPLSGCRVLELAGLGPGPFAGMLLADLGAEVVRVDRPGGSGFFAGMEDIDILNRGKQSLLLDLKRPEAVDVLLGMIEHADVLIEGYRPGVAEKLGVGPEACLARNRKLVYGRITGWGQDGPLAQTAGHDIDYVALTGALHAIGPADGPPQIPLNLLGDFGGGGAYLVIGVLAALRDADRTGTGQVVDAAIVDGVTHLLSAVHMMMAAGVWADRRESNMLDGGTPYYSVYETADGRHMAVGALEPKFYAELLAGLGLDEPTGLQHDKSRWPGLRAKIAAAFKTRSQADWSAHFAHSDACAAPIETLTGAADNPHVRARRSLVEVGGVLQSAPAPRFSKGRARVNWPPPRPGEHSREVLKNWGSDEVDDLIARGVAIEAEEVATP
ncbi:fatty acid-CoA racemase [Rhodococcus opacus PD630]|uniref:CaiB/BaiF CoA transferase family protein n=1 Tax=Rhodococcus opacus TaxID=37919 RepID=UPI00029CB4D7|nr:CaiB/BaiF CoA-transferase family protein [Rhodococcus opacus]AHK36113.1 Alpha-methylacyl-CoA racemase [Rhodococcus opacus PD630]EHI43616.1 fatty acid-CoA racemase [Rhodococcus opacus PD630]UDH01258.1 CoA transferase [Rhodococcus opacus PD630]